MRALEAHVPGRAPFDHLAAEALPAMRTDDLVVVQRRGRLRHGSVLSVRSAFYAHAMPDDSLKRAVAEFIGAFTLTFIGAGAIVTAAHIHDPSLIGVALAHGLAIAIMVSAFGHISGGHFNPAIT